MSPEWRRENAKKKKQITKEEMIEAINKGRADFVNGVLATAFQYSDPGQYIYQAADVVKNGGSAKDYFKRILEPGSPQKYLSDIVAPSREDDDLLDVLGKLGLDMLGDPFTLMSLGSLGVTSISALRNRYKNARNGI